MKLVTRLISSLDKIFPDEVKGEPLKSASLLKNEAFSIQVAYKNEHDFNEITRLYLRVETDLDISLISEYAEGYVPLIRVDIAGSDDYFERKTAGLYRCAA